MHRLLATIAKYCTVGAVAPPAGDPVLGRGGRTAVAHRPRRRVETGSDLGDVAVMVEHVELASELRSAAAEPRAAIVGSRSEPVADTAGSRANRQLSVGANASVRGSAAACRG